MTLSAARQPYFQIFSRKPLLGRRQWYFRLRAANHKIITTSEGYYNREDCFQTLLLVRNTDGDTPIEHRD